ncbi:predicted protein [Botrytis cinerea T4]|uniref:Uncharacterized protein n=1 Tax=Botryotinia fuckeliana (strain T4) TaxID=999810 RepID=G2YU54_BOTF4|nr:predicted protein [Botrytis cinerea T4]
MFCCLAMKGNENLYSRLSVGHISTECNFSINSE